MKHRSKLTAIGCMSALALALGACATTGSYYQPFEAAHSARGGYSEVRLGEDRYEVVFTGNRLTSREQVETYLLYRAAELTLQAGFEWFLIEQQGMEHTVDRQAWADPSYSPWFAGNYTYWRPYWRYYRPSLGWQIWYPYGRDPFWADRMNANTVERFEAKANIRLGRGLRPNGGLQSFDAREVLNRLAPRIKRPNP